MKTRIFHHKKISLFKKCLAVFICVSIMAVYFQFMRLSSILTHIIVSPDKDMLGQTLNEFFYAVSSIAIAYICGRPPQVLFGSKKGKWYKRNRKMISWFIAIEIIASLTMNTFLLNLQNVELILRPFQEIVMFPIFMLLIGIAEEVLFRGLIAESMRKVFRDNDMGAIISGILFGLMHLVNLRSCDVTGVLVQVCSAAAAGMLMADMYYYSGTIWTSVIFHSAIDFCGLIGFGLFGIESATSIISSYSPVMAILPLLYIVFRVFQCRKKSKLIARYTQNTITNQKTMYRKSA